MYGMGGKKLNKKGMSEKSLNRINRLHRGGITIPVVNNIPGTKIDNMGKTLRQGDCPSSNWFCYSIDLMLIYLDRRLTGITIYSLPVLGPAEQNEKFPLPEAKCVYKVTGYCDDCKPAVTSREEFRLIDRAVALFEQASGCKLHRDPALNKCKFLPLGKWNATLRQEDIPLPYLKISEKLDMLDV